jgi:hypothetical protein
MVIPEYLNGYRNALSVLFSMSFASVCWGWNDTLSSLATYHAGRLYGLAMLRCSPCQRATELL